MQPVSNTNSSGTYAVDLIDSDSEDKKPRRAYESSNDEGESDSEDFAIDGSQRRQFQEKRRSDTSSLSSSSSTDSEEEKTSKTIKDVPSSGNAKDTTEDFYKDPGAKVALMSEKDIREIKDPTVLQNLLIECQNVAVSCMSKATYATNKVEEFRSKTQVVLSTNMMRLAGANTAINQQNRQDIARINRANVINTVSRVASFAITVLLGILTMVCIFV